MDRSNAPWSADPTPPGVPPVRSARVVVVGGGVVGAAAAYRLVRRGASVTLVDARLPGRASMAGAGIVAPAGPTPATDEWYRISFPGVAHYRSLLAALREDGAPDTSFRRVGELVVARTEREESDLTELVARLDRLAKTHGGTDLGRVRVLTGAEARRVVPWLGPCRAAVHLDAVARVDGRRLCRALLHGFRRRGGRVVHAVGSVRAERGRAAGVQVGGQLLDADRVISAVGAWGGDGRTDLPGLPIRPERGQLVHLGWENAGADDLPVVAAGGHYVVPFPGRLVTGATREPDCGFGDHPTARGTQQVLAETLRVAPELGTARLIETRVGFRPVTTDGLPIVGPDWRLAGLYHAGGLGGWGLTVGAFLGAACADMCLGAAPEPILRPLLPERFR